MSVDQAAEEKWFWWAGRNDECFQVGPCPTREAAIAAAADERLGEFHDETDGFLKLRFEIVEAQSAPLRLADWIDADSILERADENLADSDRIGEEDGPWFDASSEQEADLVASLKAAADAWQVRHGLRFTCKTFSNMRNEETVVLPVLGQGADA